MGLYQELPDNSYIKKLLVGIDDAFVERFLQTKRKYELAKDKEDKRMFRDTLSNLFWELYSRVATMLNPEMSTAKRLFLRYGLTDLRNLSPEDQKFILNQPTETVDYSTETIFYVDEWLQGILDGKINPSVSDEAGPQTPAASASVSSPKSKAKQEEYIALLGVEQKRFEGFLAERTKFLDRLGEILKTLKEVRKEEGNNYAGVFDAEQNKFLDEVTFIHKEIKKINKEISASTRTMAKAQQQLDDINQSDGGASGPVDLNREKIASELINIRQMFKMTVGRQGNGFPYLTSGFLPKETKEYLFRSNVRKKLNKWLTLDPEAFYRTYKGEQMNIMPYMILMPGYGGTGACWEPLDSNNKKFGRGRVVLPIFTRTPDLSLLTGVGDIRWQAAKEIASYYWMEEGLTGRYYEYYLDAKLKGDLRTLFIKDYLLWMTKETQGMQKLEQNARYVFWRYVPLPQEDKIRLSQKGYYYNQLWEKEQVWKKSQG